MTRTSISPSLSKSPNAQPRLECVAAIPGPASSINSSNLAVAQIAEHQARRLERILRAASLDLRIDAAGHDKEVRIAVIIEIDDAGAPTDEPRLHAESRCATVTSSKLPLPSLR